MTVYRRPDPIPLRHSRPATAFALRPVRAEQEDLHHLVSRQIFTAIVSGHYPEGSILPNEQALSEELGVSRTALRESIKGLVSKGLIETRRRRGTQVLDRSQWNLLDPEMIGWLRKNDGRLVSRQLWEAVALVLPNLAGLAATHRVTVALSASGLPGGESTAETRVEFLLGIARAAGNRFLFSLASMSLQDLLQADPAFVEQQTQWLDAQGAREVLRLIAEGQANTARRWFADRLSQQAVTQDS